MRQKLENYFYNIWYAQKSVPWYLNVLSGLFDFLRRARAYFYKVGVFKTTHVSRPIIVVGNISVGGTGKTPVVLYLIRLLRGSGLKVGVISRGYGSQLSQNKHTVSLVTSGHTAMEVGDEPYLLFSKTQVPMAIGRDRVKVARELLNKFPDLDVLISDDGLQHYHLQRDIEIVVVDAQRQFGNSKLLPAGPLREPLERLQCVDLILSNGLIKSTDSDWKNDFNVHDFSLSPLSFKGLNNTLSVDLTFFTEQTVHAFAGIGNPERFFSSLKKLGLTVVEHKVADHGLMPNSFFSEHKNDIIIMTEKDAVKYPSIKSDNIWYLPVETVFTERSRKTILDTLFNKIRNCSL